MAPARSPAHPCWHVKAEHLGHPWIPQLPRAHLRSPAAAVPRRTGASRQAARCNTPERKRGPPPGLGSPSGTYRSPLRPFAPQRGPGSAHTSGMQGGTPEQHQETENPSRSRRRSRTPPPAARLVAFHKDTDRDRGGPSDPHAQQASSTTDPRRRSKRPRAGRAHIPTIPTPAKRERQAALHKGPRRPRLPAHPSPPCQGRWPACCRWNSTPRTRGQGNPRPTTGLRKGWRDNPPNTPPASGAQCDRSRTRAAAIQCTGPVHHGVPQPSCNTAIPPGRGGRIATTGAGRERPRSGRRNDRNLQPSGVR